jgi:squalene-hopene/tetraprenyl-beta-curcumene cyclase
MYRFNFKFRPPIPWAWYHWIPALWARFWVRCKHFQRSYGRGARIISAEHLMKPNLATSFLVGAGLAGGLMSFASEPGPSKSSWNAKAAATYLDGRQAWWMAWPTAARDHDTPCVSCHTALPYALARPRLRSVLGETEISPTERLMVEHVTRRVRLWLEVEPFYPDQTRGLPKTSESRGTEAILNAIIMATRDADAGMLSEDGKKAFDNLWKLQFRAGEQNGAWAWLDFHNEPWEAPGSQYFGNALAAVAIGTAPQGYGTTPAIQDSRKALAAYLRGGVDKATLLNRAMILWASARIPDVLATDRRQRIIDDLLSRQQSDGGWGTASLVGEWKRRDQTPLDPRSDGFATGLVTLALRQSGRAASDPAVAGALAWLVEHQDRATGTWSATSPNKERDPESDAGKFMRDAATGYAVLALTEK